MTDRVVMSDDRIVQALTERAALAKLRIETNKKNSTYKRDYEHSLSVLTKQRDKLKDVLSIVKKNLKILESYALEKEGTTKKEIYKALYEVDQVVEGTSPAILKIEDKEMWLEDEDGYDLNRMEPSSWRAMSSVKLRKAVLSNTTFMQDMILDEPLSVLDAQSSADFSLQLPALAKDSLIILIEQKDAVFSNTDTITYFFEKIGKISTVRRIGHEI